MVEITLELRIRDCVSELIVHKSFKIWLYTNHSRVDSPITHYSYSLLADTATQKVVNNTSSQKTQATMPIDANAFNDTEIELFFTYMSGCTMTPAAFAAIKIEGCLDLSNLDYLDE